MNTQRNLLTAASLLFLMSSTAHAAVATIQKDTSWTRFEKESAHDFKCPDNKVLVGRGHDGDENQPTTYLCGTVSQNGTVLKKFNEQKISSDWLGMCPAGKVMTGRGRSGDENEPFWVYCAEFRDAWEDNLVVTPSQILEGDESDHKLECATNGVFWGTVHAGDENKNTSYFCAKLF
ncbi:MULTISPECIES: hypothetical protein [unclassified Pseudomonas]|uniref:hypothetical protein n=1 Tax=unclassified Pseudomonas TaxID=196821 RepID=UPI00224AE988|nr:MULTISPECIES: hypothetical protein [unclassified Pseudomonas]MCX2891033.1 hypothetical protein [Pseudomonas sp. DCB_BI]MDH4550631.1 hypothetical protein [Pseudomonas sp. BN607]